MSANIVDIVMTLILRVCGLFMSTGIRRELHEHLSASFERKYDAYRSEALVERTGRLLRL